MLLACLVAFALVRGHDGRTDSERLPGDTAPESYALSVSPFSGPDNAAFAGRVEILIAVNTATSAIALNSKSLVLDRVSLADEKIGKQVGVASWNYVPRLERVEIRTERYLVTNRKYILSIDFRGVLRNDSTGFFRSSYPSDSGEKWLAMIQFHPVYARSTFPCYDEPVYRTPFSISIERNRDEIALSNMPVSYTEDVERNVTDGSAESRKSTWVHFKQTPPIPTHLVEFFVGGFEYLDTAHRNLVNVYSHLGYLYQIEYVTEKASGMLKDMETFTEIPLVLPEIDLIAVPDLSLGAMESWALHVYRDKSLFYTKDSKTKTKGSAQTTTQHVIAHQWFGCMVTPVWWDYAWLSEGFATYFEYFATAKEEPDWRLADFFVVERHQTALEYDQTPKHPLSASVNTPTEIVNVFDEITYDKGAAVIKMLNAWVGDEVFKKALNLYLSRNQ